MKKSFVRRTTAVFPLCFILLMCVLSGNTAASDEKDTIRFVLKNEAGFCVAAIKIRDNHTDDSNKDTTTFCAGDQSRVKFQDLISDGTRTYGLEYNAKVSLLAKEWLLCKRVSLKTVDGRITEYRLTTDDEYVPLNPKNNPQMVSFVFELSGTTLERSCRFKEVNRRKEEA